MGQFAVARSLSTRRVFDIVRCAGNAIEWHLANERYIHRVRRKSVGTRIRVLDSDSGTWEMTGREIVRKVIPSDTDKDELDK